MFGAESFPSVAYPLPSPKKNTKPRSSRLPFEGRDTEELHKYPFSPSIPGGGVGKVRKKVEFGE